MDENARENLKLNFHIKEGSSDISSDAQTILPELLGKIMDGLGPKAKLVIALVTLLGFFGSSPVTEWVRDNYDIQKTHIQSEDHNHDLEHLDRAITALSDLNKEQLSENQKTMQMAAQEIKEAAEIQNQAKNATSEIVKQARDADNVSLQGYTIPGKTIRMLDTSHRKAGKDVRLKELFFVVSATTGSDGFNCKIKRNDGVIIQATLTDALMSDKDMEKIQRAFWEKEKIYLSVVARKVGPDFRNAKIEAASSEKI